MVRSLKRSRVALVESEIEFVVWEMWEGRVDYRVNVL